MITECKALHRAEKRLHDTAKQHGLLVHNGSSRSSFDNKPLSVYQLPHLIILLRNTLHVRMHCFSCHIFEGGGAFVIPHVLQDILHIAALHLSVTTRK